MSFAIVICAVLAVVVLAACALVGWGIGLYNGLVVLRNRFKNAYA